MVVYLFDKNPDDSFMTREEIRRENARRLASNAGAKAAFARLVGMDASQVSQLIGPSPSKNIGNSIARRIEQAHHLPEGWLDTEHPEFAAPAAVDAAVPLSAEDVKRLMPDAMPVQVVDSDDPALTHIPKVKLRLSAGISGFDVEPERFDGSTTTVPTHWIERNGYNREQLIAIRVKGESMEPTLYEDDLVVVNYGDVRLVDGNVYAVNYEGEAVVKRLTRDAGKWWLTSDNSDQVKFYRRICQGNDCIIVGRVVRKESERL